LEQSTLLKALYKWRWLDSAGWNYKILAHEGVKSKIKNGQSEKCLPEMPVL